ncbi:Proteasome subunit beta type-1 [Teratosphaeria destructans]|uniref:Proteasome subunit beta type-1 n=1 Tax=Teratosphaeria destructans TaxID=418781 RepID=A0A9W7SZA4_9PEZI|nr:Proteasome subunit beta type-1 [Teratosphaeria destructans]
MLAQVYKPHRALGNVTALCFRVPHHRTAAPGIRKLSQSPFPRPVYANWHDPLAIVAKLQAGRPGRALLVPGHVLLPPDPAAVSQLQQGSPEPQQVFKESVDRGTATACTALLCFDAYTAKTSHLPWHERLSLLHRDGPGRSVLLWLLTANDPRHFLDFTASNGLVRCTIQFMILEGQEELLWDMLDMSIPHLDDESKRGYAAVIWRGNLARAIVECKLGFDREGRADGAISAIFRYAHMKERSTLSAIRRAPLYSVAQAFANGFQRARYPNTNVVLYDRFLNFYERYFVERAHLARPYAYNLARFRLHHPRTPDARRACDILHAFERDDSELQRFFNSPVSKRRLLDRFILQTRDVLKSQGDPFHEQPWLIQLLRKVRSDPAHPRGKVLYRKGGIDSNHLYLDTVAESTSARTFGR